MSLAQYNEQLRHTTGSKIFWLKHINPEEIGLVVDFGCADGHILKTIRPLLPEDALLVGIDKDPEQIIAANQHFVDGDHFSTDWEYADHFLNDMPRGKKSVLVLSSVIHEIGEEFPRWWKEEVESRRFDYVAIRDTAVPRDEFVPYGGRMERPALDCLRGEEERLAYRETVWRYHPWAGASSVAKLHGLLKAVHAGPDFLSREHAENYFPFSSEDLLVETCNGRYGLTAQAFTITTFFVNWCKDRGIALPPGKTTHVEVLLARCH